MRLSGMNNWADHQAEIQFQNEHLVLRVDGVVKAIVPDLICCLDTHSEWPFSVIVAVTGTHLASVYVAYILLVMVVLQVARKCADWVGMPVRSV